MKYSIISKYRSQIMGVAVVWIAILHASMWFPIEPINWIKLIGQNGVDLFMFLSSFGLYYAYQKNSDTKEFIKKRLLRIIPIFIPIVIFRCIYLDYSLKDSLMLISTLSFWLKGDRVVWFVASIIPLYLITPFYLKKFKGNEIKSTIISVILTFILSVVMMDSKLNVFFSRIPIFFLGFLAGYYSYNDKTISKKSILMFVGLFLLGFGIQRYGFTHLSEDQLWKYGLYFYPMIVSGWSFCLLVGYLCDKADKFNIPLVNNFLMKMGKVSFEFYLLHELMIVLMSNIIYVADLYAEYGIVFNVIVMFMTYYVSVYYQDFMNWFMKILNKYFLGKVNKKIFMVLGAVGLVMSIVVLQGHNIPGFDTAVLEESKEKTFEVVEVAQEVQEIDVDGTMKSFNYNTKNINGIPVMEIYNGNTKGKPVVFMLHGLTGSKEGFSYLGTKFAEKDMFVVNVDASGHGARNDGKHAFYEIVNQSKMDVENLLEYYYNNTDVDVSRYGVVGFSMGGMSSYLIGCDSKYKPMVIAPIASVANYSTVADLYLSYTYVENGQTTEDMNSTQTDILYNINPYNDITRLKGTYVMIGHGKEDPLFNYGLSEVVYEDMISKGIKCEINLYDEVGHNIPNNMVPILVEKFREILVD